MSTAIGRRALTGTYTLDTASIRVASAHVISRHDWASCGSPCGTEPWPTR